MPSAAVANGTSRVNSLKSEINYIQKFHPACEMLRKKDAVTYNLSQ